MDKPLQNDLKDCGLPEQLSEILTCDSSHSSNAHDAEGEEVCNSEKVVNEVVPVDGGITHQSGSPQTNCESPVGTCQSIQEVQCADSGDQSVPDLQSLTPQSSSSENIQQKSQTVDVSPLEGVAIPQKFVSQASSGSSHITGLLNGSMKCDDGACGNGCEDMSLDRDSKELSEVLCATLQTDPSDSSEVHDSCLVVGSPSSVDGRERFSENSDLSQEMNVESISSSEDTLLLCDRGDQTCISSISVDSGIQSKLTDVESIVKQCSDMDEPGKTIHLCTLADGTPCCLTDKPCQHSLVKILAVSVVDEVLEGAAKHLLNLETQGNIPDVRKSSSNLEDIQEQVSGYEQGFRQNVTGGDGDVAGKVSVVEKPLDINCSLAIVSNQIISPVSNRDNVIECAQPTDEKLDSHTQSCVDGLTAVIYNGNIVTPSHSTPLNDSSPVLNLSAIESVPNLSECRSDVDEQPFKGNDLTCEAKGVSQNDCFERCEDTDANVKEIQSCGKEILCWNFGEKSENVIGSGDVCDKMDVSLDEHNLNFEAKVQSSKDICGEADDKSFPVANGACVKGDSSDVANSQKEIASSSATLVLCTSVDESGDFNMSKEEPNLGVMLKSNDLTASSSCNVDDNTDLKCAEPKLNPQEAVSTDYVHKCSPVSNEVGCDLELSTTKVEDITEPNPVDHFTNSSSFQENNGQDESMSAEMDSDVKEVNIVSDDSGSDLSLEKAVKNSPTGKEGNSLEKVVALAVSAPASPQEETEMKSITCKEENLEEDVIPSAEFVPATAQEENLEEEVILFAECVPATAQEENLEEEVIPSAECVPTAAHKESEKMSVTVNKENLVEEMSPSTESAQVSPEETSEQISRTGEEENLVAEVISCTESDNLTPDKKTEEMSITGQEENVAEEIIPSTESAHVSPEVKTEEMSMIGQEEKLVEKLIPSIETALVSPQEETKTSSVTNKEKNLGERSVPVSQQEETGKECILEKEENMMEEVIASLKSSPVSPQEGTGKLENIGEEECSLEEAIPTADSSASDSSHDNVEYSKLVVCGEEAKSEEVSLKDDISASIPLLGNTEDLADEDHNSTALLSGSTDVPLAKQEQLEASSTSNHCGENSHLPTSTMPFIVPTVNICPPIMEETYDGITDDESEISHATSDSESDSNVKMVKPVCDGMNTINYKPLLEEDSNDRSTLSLISELDETSVREELEDEAASLIMEHSVDQNEKDNSELVQRVKGQRIRHDKMEEATRKEGKPVQGSPNAEFAAKVEDIKEALKSGSLERLKELARAEGGLVNDEIRREVWPRLLGFESSSSNPLPPISMEELRKHHEYNQVVLDVNRSLRRFPSKISAEERVKLQDQLTEIILRVLMKRKDLSYYQGYHDVAVTTLLVAGKDAAFHILDRISIAHLSDCMLPTMERTMYLLNYIYPLIQRINPHLAERMDRVEVGTIFCLPWYLTWYGYSLNRYEDVVRVFDYFLASAPLAPLYLAAVVVGRRSAEVLAADCDHATVHSMLSRIPETLPLEDLLREATDLYRNYPPDDIETEVHERCERLQKAQEEEEEQRKRIRQRRMIQRRHSMPTIAARQMPGWFILDRFLGLPMIQGRRIIQVSATVMFGMIAWHLRSEMYRYF